MGMIILIMVLKRNTIGQAWIGLIWLRWRAVVSAVMKLGVP
jgi:hypothetical protein